MNLKKYIPYVLIICTTESQAFDFKIKSKSCIIENIEYSAIGYGTYPFKGQTCIQALDKAIKMGFQIIDTATFYQNFDAIGFAIKKYNRQNLYLISKVWPDAHTCDKLRKDLLETLKLLHTEYLDAYLLHWPNSKVSIKETLLTMKELQNKGLIRHIGLSNVTVHHIKRALQIGVPISWVQVEMNPSFYDDQLLEFCRQHAIGVQAWAPLGRGKISHDIFLAEIAKKYKKTASQIALRWILQHGCIPLVGTKNSNHMRENKEIMDFELSHQDMQAIDQRAKRGKRERVTANFGLGFTDEFDYTYEQCWPK